MDVFSHALWGRHLTYRRVDWRLAAAMGVLPDLFAFIPSTIYRIFKGQASQKIDENTVTSDLPAIAWDLYQISHSFIWTFVLFLLIWGSLEIRLRRIDSTDKLPVGKWLKTSMSPRTAALFLISPWVFHILIDIPTHTINFFPTPFLMPLSDFKVDGIAWSVWWILTMNGIALLVVWWLLKRDESQRTAAMASMAPLA